MRRRFRIGLEVDKEASVSGKAPAAGSGPDGPTASALPLTESRAVNTSTRRRFSSGEFAVVGFTSAYMAIALIASFALENSEFVFYLVVMLVLIAAVFAVHWTNRLRIGALWGLSIWGLAHIAGGLMPIPASWPVGGDSHALYNWWLIPGLLKYDQVIHAYGFGLMTWICWQCLQRAFASRGVVAKPTFGLLTLCAGGGMGFGALNEVVEFAATLTLSNTNVGGYENTGWDLVSNLVGCVATAGLIAICEARRQRRTKEG